jgi:hypothetical protein
MRFWKEKSVEDTVTLGPTARATLVIKKKKQGECHIVALSFTLNRHLKEKEKNYGNSNISSSKNIIF